MRLDPTLVAARILGPLFVLAGVLLIIRPEIAIWSMRGFTTSQSLMVMAAFVTLTIGFALITFHQRWDTFTASLISVIGWLFVVRGAVMLLAPELIEVAVGFVQLEPQQVPPNCRADKIAGWISECTNLRFQAVPIGGLLAALLGVWLTYTGYIAGMLRFDHPTR